ncbi:MAG: DNA polymerase I [Saprospiraceae bacterium]|nr:DNA polymerase I [Saprospiraceae bacterium]
MKKLFLLDAYALIYRAHFAFIKRPLINSKGFNVSAISGFVSTLWDVLQKEKPSHIAVAFDMPALTFRHEMYEPYKANREEQPEDITRSIPIIKNIVKAFNIPVVEKAGFEADDIIGTLAKQAEKEGFQVYMMTPDKDYAQLVTDKVFLYKPARMGKGIDVFGVKEVLEKWQVQSTEQIIDLLGLQGDAVDNIPGVRGVGPKTAVKLLAQYGTIENILKNTHELKGKQRERLETDKEAALLSKKLATIKTDVDVTFDAESYQHSEYNYDKLLEYFKELEFRTLTKRIVYLQQKGQTDTPQNVQTDLFGNPISTAQKAESKMSSALAIVDKNIDNVEHNYHLIDTADKRQELIQTLNQQKVFCFDTETTGIDANRAELVGIAFSFKAHEAYYVPLPKEREAALKLITEFKEVLENPKIEKIGQNLKYDLLILRWYDIKVQGKFWDTMLMHYVLEPEKRHNMTYLSETYLNYAPVPIEKLIGKKGKNQLSMRDVDLDKVKEYAAEDADITFQLKEVLDKLLKEEIRMLYEEVEEPLITILADIEYNGVNLDVPFLSEYEKIIDTDIQEMKKAIFDAANGLKFNLDSPKQVGEVFFNQLKIPYRWKKTKTGQYSTNESKLTELAEDNKIVADLLEYRSLAKLKSTYIDALPRLVNPKTNRIHSSFNQALTVTGRLSSQNPNLQNIPIRSAKGKEIRKAFVPKDAAHTLIAADYSQIELRLIAEISKDEAMLEAFQSGQDIHKATAARIFDVPIDEVTKEQRYRAKTVNFSIIYGAGATNLSKNLEIKRSEAQQLIEQYFKQYSGIKSYMENVVNQARIDGYVTTLKGRRRYLRDLNSKNSMVRSHAERNAVNTPIQGTAADMIKLAMIQVQAALEKGKFKTKMILQVHDELVFDVPNAELEKVKPIIEEAMRTALKGLKVPILVGIDTGQNWLEAH